MEDLRSLILSTLKTVDPEFECEILGSYRRGIPFSSDLDVAIRHPSFVEKDDEETAKPLLKSVVAHLEKEELLEKENALMLGAKKYAVRVLLEFSFTFAELTPSLDIRRVSFAFPTTSTTAASTSASVPTRLTLTCC
jgi:hypothetical protein